MKKIVNIVISILLIIAGIVGLSSASHAATRLGTVSRGLGGAPAGTIRLEKILDLRDSEMHQSVGGWKYVDNKVSIAGATVPDAPYGTVVQLPGQFTIKWSNVGYDADGSDIDMYLTASDMKGVWVKADDTRDTRPARLNNNYRALTEWSVHDGNGSSSDYYRDKVAKGFSTAGAGTFGAEKLTTSPSDVGSTDIGNDKNSIKNFAASTKFTIAFKKAGTQTAASGTYVMHVDDVDQPDHHGLGMGGLNNYDTSTLNPLRAEHFYMGSGIHDVWIDNNSTLQDVTNHPRWAEFGDNYKFIGSRQITDTTASLRFTADPTFSFRAGGNGGNELFGNIFAPPREIPVVKPTIKRHTQCGETDEVIFPKSKYYEMYKSSAERTFSDHIEYEVNVKPLNGTILTNAHEYPKTIRLNVQPPCTKPELPKIATMTVSGNVWANFDDTTSFGEGDKSVVGAVVTLKRHDKPADGSSEPLTTDAGSITIDESGSYKFENVKFDDKTAAFSVEIAYSGSNTVAGSRLDDKNAYEHWRTVGSVNKPTVNEPLTITGDSTLYKFNVDANNDNIVVENVNSAIGITKTPKPYRLIVDGTVWYDTPGSVAGSYDEGDKLLDRVVTILRDNNGNELKLNDGARIETSDAVYETPASHVSMGNYQLGLQQTEPGSDPYFTGIELPKGTTLDSKFTLEFVISDDTQIDVHDVSTRLGNTNKFNSWSVLDGVNKPTENKPLSLKSNKFTFTLRDAVKVDAGDRESRVYRLANVNAAVKTEPLADVTINKVSPDGSALTGAVFTVSNNNGFSQELDMSQVSSAVMSLPNGTYYLTETTAPDGFALLPSAIEFTIADDKVTIADRRAAVKVDGLSMTVTNFKPGELPRSGGSLPFILAGACMILAAGGYLIYRKRDE